MYIHNTPLVINCLDDEQESIKNCQWSANHIMHCMGWDWQPQSQPRIPEQIRKRHIAITFLAFFHSLSSLSETFVSP